jgi:hypothetical protein
MRLTIDKPCIMVVQMVNLRRPASQAPVDERGTNCAPPTY